jgi:hypothetical protein
MKFPICRENCETEPAWGIEPAWEYERASYWGERERERIVAETTLDI